jgi:aspartate/methionine/tyrosine aminotransferase
MRNHLIINDRTEKLSYEIREIVLFANQIKSLGQSITWENIGDPIAKGEQIPNWIKEIIRQKIKNNDSYGYAPTKGIDQTREFLANLVNQRKKVQITKEDIIFFNGLGDAVAKIYGLLDPTVRVIGPSPAYSTHSSAEAAHAGAEHITYELNPEDKWRPNIQDLRMKVKYNPNILGILIINPNNPTGAVYPKNYLEEIIKIAKEFDLFVIADEIYINTSYGGHPHTALSDVVGKVCGISMKGISKEFPWPGARCGWLEFYNAASDKTFKKYVQAILKSKMLEVSSTTLPQLVLSEIISDARYQSYQKKRNQIFKKRAEFAWRTLKDVGGIKVVKPEGAFYMTVMFKKGFLKPGQKLKINNQRIKKFIEKKLKKISLWTNVSFIIY